jgi:hypothetical protein
MTKHTNGLAILAGSSLCQGIVGVLAGAEPPPRADREERHPDARQAGNRLPPRDNGCGVERRTSGMRVQIFSEARSPRPAPASGEDPGVSVLAYWRLFGADDFAGSKGAGPQLRGAGGHHRRATLERGGGGRRRGGYRHRDLTPSRSGAGPAVRRGHDRRPPLCAARRSRGRGSARLHRAALRRPPALGGGCGDVGRREPEPRRRAARAVRAASRALGDDR